MGLIHIYYGDGKGKSTAAAGLALRARGRDFPVLFQQYLKDGRSGELKPLREAGAETDSGMPEEASGFTWEMDAAQKAALRRYQDERLKRAASWYKAHEQKPGVLVLDEILASAELNLVDAGALLRLCERVKADEKGPDLVLTGRKPSPELRELADYLSEIRAVRHPFERGVAARPGIEF